ncbi:integral membrane sensor signal transduction histidine kinase [Actinobacteria bacterium OK074]|nr:integral membrane sensor signal transduction histidine kinase [Actinobacteria bacterium OK074]
MRGSAGQVPYAVPSGAFAAPGPPVADTPVDSVRRTAVLVAGAGAVFGVFVLVLTAPDRYADSTTTLFSGAVGGLYLGAGLLARLRRPRNAVGLLMLLVGIGWFAEDLQISTHPAVHTVGLFLKSASSGFLIPLLLVFPDGRLRDRTEHGAAAAVVDRALLVAGCTAAFVLVPIGALFYPSRVANLALVHPVRWQQPVVDAVQLAVSAAVVAVLVWRWLAATVPARRGLVPLIAVGVVGGLASGLDALFGSAARSHDELLDVAHVSVLLLPVAFLAGVSRVRLGRTAVAELLRRMPLGSRAQLRDELARTLGDRSLHIGFPAPDGVGYVDTEGRPLVVAGGRAVSSLERDGRRVGVLVHDPALREDRYVLEAVVSAAALELDNQRLTAEVRAQLAELRDSRRRIIEAGDEQRQKVERDLHDGAQQRFVVLELQLRLARQRLAARERPDPELARLLEEASGLLERGHAELRVVARGIHPAVLHEAGLVPALRSLAVGLPLPVDIRADDLPELPGPVALTAYYVVRQAVTNVLQHAAAGSVGVELAHADGVLRVSVTDDGVGGADPGAGTGLLGLRHRVAAYDGELTVRSRPGEGTVVSATLPTAVPPATARSGSPSAGEGGAR